ncbi:hypothetical protein L211DRAFT_851551 [Terfezia boudieri ATCC MYA-4762]|uniref:CCHC-type domain-containing protein n=1 Tax=Terfezia boudieri ATCC MYA-4762 TaxID=1051890 RepID=A0A3N4LTN7_9PEZI|nr:hypothetical protein L211DRAFT_851551 [Terfezia boudieri ATCC MYA-4762]
MWSLTDINFQGPSACRNSTTRKPTTSVLTNSRPANSPEYAWLTFTAYSNETADSPGGEESLDSLIGSGVTQDMAPPPRGVLFGPILDWGKGSSKVLLEVNDDGGIRRTRQYVLEEVTKWHLVPGFGEEGSRALLQVCANTERCKREWQGGEDWDLYISQQERQGREDEEILRVKDGPSAERAIEILGKGIAIQDSSVNGRLEGFDFTYEQAEVEDNMLESITVRPMRPDGSVLDGMTHRWTLSTPRPVRRGLQGMVAQEMEGLEARMEGVQEEAESGSEDERRKKRNTRLGKKPRLEGSLTLRDLDTEYGGGLEPAKARPLREVRGNVFGTAPLAEGEEDTAMEDIPLTATQTKKTLGLKGSRHATIDLTGEADSSTEDTMEGQGQDKGKEKVDAMEAEGEGTETKNRSWKSVWDSREAMTIIYGIKRNGEVLEEINALGPKERSWKSARDAKVARDWIKAGGGCIEGGWYLDGDEAGGGGWKAISREAVAKGNLQHMEWIMEAERTWRGVSEVKASQIAGVERELVEVKKQLTLLAVSLGAGTPEQVAEAKRTINTRRGRVEEEKRKQEELRKVEKKRQEEEASRKQEELNKEEAIKLAVQAGKVKESQEKAREACEATIQDLAKKFRPGLNPDEMIALGQKMKEAEEMKKRIEKEAAAPVERLVGRSAQVIGTEVFKVVRVVMGHVQPLDTKGRTDLESAAGKVNNLLRVRGLTDKHGPWQVTAKAGQNELCDESTWEVRRVREEVDPAKVAGEVGTALMSVFGRTGDMLNVWVENLKSVKLMVPSAPMMIPKSRKELGEKIMQENKGLRTARRYPKLWSTAKVTGFTFDVADDQEAKRVINEGLMWEGKRRRVSYFDQVQGVSRPTTGTSRTKAINGPGGSYPQQLRGSYPQQLQGTGSTVRCHNCGGLGHIQKNCSSVSIATATKVSRKAGLGVAGASKKQRVVDEEGFTLVGEKRVEPKEPGLGMGARFDWAADDPLVGASRC